MTWFLVSCVIVYVTFGLWYAARNADNLFELFIERAWVRWVIGVGGAAGILLSIVVLWPLFRRRSE
jgi:hypothetical protein